MPPRGKRGNVSISSSCDGGREDSMMEREDLEVITEGSQETESMPLERGLVGSSSS